MSSILNVTCISEDLNNFLSEKIGQQTTVHSVYQRAVNFLAEDDSLFTLGTAGLELMPMGMLVDDNCNMSACFRTRDYFTIVPSGLLNPEKCLRISTSQARVWSLAFQFGGELRSDVSMTETHENLNRFLREQTQIGLLPLQERLTGNSKEKGHELEDVFCRFIADDLVQFTREIGDLNWQSALDISKKLIGFGMGSTPSCDDFLSAYLLIFSISDSLKPQAFPWHCEFGQKVVQLAQKRTTRMSAEMLRHAANGRTSRNHQQLMRACLFETQTDVLGLAKRVSQSGASSGVDFLLGLCCALDWFDRNVLMNSKKGGVEQVEASRSQFVTII